MLRFLALVLLSLIISGCGIINNFVGYDSQPVDSPEIDSASDEPPQLDLLLDEAITMDTGSYCWTTAEVGICADMMPPIYDTDSHIAITVESLDLQFVSTPPTSISAYLHPGSNLMTRIADIPLEATLNQDGTVSIPLIEQLDGDYVLVVAAYWQGESPTGDAMYTLPIRISN